MELDLSWLTSRRLTAVEHAGHGTWRFHFGDDAEVHSDSPWRLFRDGRIALSSEDHGHRYGLPGPIDAEAACVAEVGGAVVRSAEVRDESRDFVVTFESGVRLEIVPLSSGYESWKLGGPGGLFVVAQGGGDLAVWSRGIGNR
ncbi:MAG: DUF6188 family protein [Isosphaeraceae bacterium]